MGGGASIALLAMDSSISFSGCTLTSVQAGDGGHGAAGQKGQDTGGLAGTHDAAGGCDGGKGGGGASGGAGGGGAGGLSVAMMWSGTKPDTSTETLKSGTAGKAGPGGNPGVNDGKAGLSQDVYP